MLISHVSSALFYWQFLFFPVRTKFLLTLSVPKMDLTLAGFFPFRDRKFLLVNYDHFCNTNIFHSFKCFQLSFLMLFIFFETVAFPEGLTGRGAIQTWLGLLPLLNTIVPTVKKSLLTNFRILVNSPKPSRLFPLIFLPRCTMNRKLFSRLNSSFINRWRITIKRVNNQRPILILANVDLRSSKR